MAVTDNMRYLSILHCNPPICLSLCVFFSPTFPAPLYCFSKPSPPFPFSQGSWEMIPEAKHLSQQQSTEAKLHWKELQGGSGQQKVMKERGIYEINNGNKSVTHRYKLGAAREGQGGRWWKSLVLKWMVNLAFVATPLSSPARHQMVHCGWAVISKASLSVLLENTAMLAFIEQRASRLLRQGWEANLQEAVELATCDTPSFLQHYSQTLYNITMPACNHSVWMWHV